jgi:hypothetical protein
MCNRLDGSHQVRCLAALRVLRSLWATASVIPSAPETGRQCAQRNGEEALWVRM